MEEEVLESPLVARIRCEEGLDGDYGAPNVIRRKVKEEPILLIWNKNVWKKFSIKQFKILYEISKYKVKIG